MQNYINAILLGSITTIQVAILALFFATLIGIIFASFKISKRLWLNYIALAYTGIARGIPDLVIMLIMYYGIQDIINFILKLLVNKDLYIIIHPFTAGVIAISFIFGSYLAEVFRAGYNAIDKNQIQAAKSFGLSTQRLFFKIIIPNIIRHIVPGYINTWLVLLKSTAIISIIGLQDMIYFANIAGKNTKSPFMFLFLAAFIYLIFTLISTYLLKVLEKKYSFDDTH